MGEHDTYIYEGKECLSAMVFMLMTKLDKVGYRRIGTQS
jgi:hypothetical protein